MNTLVHSHTYESIYANFENNRLFIKPLFIYVELAFITEFKEKYGFKRQRKMRYSKQKPLQQMFDTEKAVGLGGGERKGLLAGTFNSYVGVVVQDTGVSLLQQYVAERACDCEL